MSENSYFPHCKRRPDGASEVQNREARTDGAPDDEEQDKSSFFNVASHLLLRTPPPPPPPPPTPHVRRNGTSSPNRELHLSSICAAVASHGPLISAKFIGEASAERRRRGAQSAKLLHLIAVQRALFSPTPPHTFKDFELLICIYIRLHKSWFRLIFFLFFSFSSLLLGQF